MRRGQVSYSKVRAVTRVATPETEQALLDVALAGTAAHVERVVRAWRQADRAAERDEDRERQADRELHTWVEDDGMVVVRGRLTPEAGSAFRRALEAAVAADRAAAGVAGADGTRAAGGGCPSGPERQPSNRKMATTAPTITPACRSIARKPSARSELIAPCSVATSARSVSGVTCSPRRELDRRRPGRRAGTGLPAARRPGATPPWSLYLPGNTHATIDVELMHSRRRQHLVGTISLRITSRVAGARAGLCRSSWRGRR